MGASQSTGLDEVKRTDQDFEELWKEIIRRFTMKAPRNPKGTYHHRAVTTIQNHWRDTVKRDINKFNKSYLKVMIAKPTGCTYQQKINIAVAMHMGKADSPSPRHREYRAENWLLYDA